jgi:hypothetical protein
LPVLAVAVAFAVALPVILSEAKNPRIFPMAATSLPSHYSQISTEIFQKPAQKLIPKNQQPTFHLHQTIHHNLSTKKPLTTPIPPQNPLKNRHPSSKKKSSR